MCKHKLLFKILLCILKDYIYLYIQLKASFHADQFHDKILTLNRKQKYSVI